MGFQRPKSLVICNGCLDFFTLLGRGEGFNTIARGGVRADPDFATLQKNCQIFHIFHIAHLKV